VPDVLVIGAGPAGTVAALRAADLGARTRLVTSSAFGGMAANDGPVPVRTLAHAARLMRNVRESEAYGIQAGHPLLDYSKLSARVRAVVGQVRAHSSLREQIDAAGVTVHENAGAARFEDPHTVTTANGMRLQADKIILCVGGAARPLNVPGFHLTSTHTAALALTSVPSSMLIIGGGATGLQVASIFHSFGSRVQVFERGARILSGEDADVSSAVAASFRNAGMTVRENFGTPESFEKTPTGVRMNFRSQAKQESAEASLVVVAAGWVADTGKLNLSAADLAPDDRGFMKVDEYLQTSTSHIFAAGDVTGRLMLVPQALQEGFVAATNAVLGPSLQLAKRVSLSAGFTDPEYASAGLTEAKAREHHDVLTATVHFDSTMRTIIDGRKSGFCKLVVDRKTANILGCQVVGERAVEIAQAAALAIVARMRVDQLARVPLAFPSYTGNLAYAAASAARQLELQVDWEAGSIDGLSSTGALAQLARPTPSDSRPAGQRQK
jgi:pyruvate/2-oxoglutarate dehydrogenase complex dihydrolipoamide dehydrogenase (E3) component